MMPLTIRFAESDDDVVAIHGFLCVVMGPLLPGGVDAIDPKESATEVWRVVNHECALMAFSADGLLVGTLGIIKCRHWWAKSTDFLANRWFASLPDVPAGKPLLEEGARFAKSLGLELHIYDEQKGRLVILNRDKRRARRNPVFDRPAVTPTHEAAALLQ